MFLAAIRTYAFGAPSDNTKSELAYLLIKQSLLVISSDIRRLFEEYLCPPSRRFGIIKPLTLDDNHQHASKNRGVFSFRDHGYLAIEERVSHAVESRNTSSFKTKHPSWTYGSFAKFRRVSVLEIRTAF